jgi:hypothetical protein
MGYQKVEVVRDDYRSIHGYLKRRIKGFSNYNIINAIGAADLHPKTQPFSIRKAKTFAKEYCGLDVQVEFVNLIWGIYGCCDATNRHIYLNERLNKYQLHRTSNRWWDTYLHELAHITSKASGHGKKFFIELARVTAHAYLKKVVKLIGWRTIK